mmetsp:Transcript_4712/g.8077  ORF Transcript_4712/g.8077 Transcript_4712/m.8077 type:complete len:325 (+) Transcript_4712:69-1043(+)
MAFAVRARCRGHAGSLYKSPALWNKQWIRLVSSQKVMLNYQEMPPAGMRNGRYIDQPDKGDIMDKAAMYEAVMHDARTLPVTPALESYGFALEKWPSKVVDFEDRKEVESVYYAEMRDVVKRLAGADTVLVFDHTIRESGNTNLNAQAGESAAPVPRVHCDYTADGAPRRLQLLGKEGINSLKRGRMLTEAEVDKLAAGRFAFINVWRPISDEPVYRMPLAVCDERSVALEDRFLYELVFPDRIGENYSLKFSADHKWYYFPRQTKEEVLVFKVYDKKEDGPRFVFHTAFDDPSTPPDAPPRRSIEARTIAFFKEEDDFRSSIH